MKKNNHLAYLLLLKKNLSYNFFSFLQKLVPLIILKYFALIEKKFEFCYSFLTIFESIEDIYFSLRKLISLCFYLFELDRQLFYAPFQLLKLLGERREISNESLSF